MAHPNPLLLGKSNSTPIYPDTWAELTPGSLSHESSSVTIPSADDISSFDLKSFCSGFNAHYGPGEILLPHLDDPNRSLSSIYSLPIALPQDPSHNALESIAFKSEDTGGAYGQCTDASSNFLFSAASVGYESSLSPSSSRPCTAGYPLDGLGFSPSAAEPPLSLSYGCGYSPNEGFSLYSHLDQPGIEAKESPKSAAEIDNRSNFPLQYMPPYHHQSNGILVPQEGMGPLQIEPSIDFQFTAGSAATANCTIPIDRTATDNYPWSSALSAPPRARLDGHFTQSEVFTTRCVQPTSLLGHPTPSAKPKDPAVEPSHSAYGKASFLPGNWESHGVFCDENINYPPAPQPLKKDTVQKKRPKRRTSAATGPLAKTDSIGTKRKRSALSPSHDSDDPSDDPPKKSSAAAENKTPDGKFVCRLICKNTQVVCGRKFQRSEHLKRHWATHEDRKPHKCPICERFFGRTDNLKQHIKTHDNAHGRNTKLLKAKLLQNPEQNKGMPKIEHKPNVYSNRASKHRKIQ
ncbi:hypothetical protein PTTG_11875 [Puccinia triticina 1-1 BBBD Race 1]|uniref:C2H2-type domain-containing protein n=1 Tax=Puccinia triticina (isolate 1-1 / race 1 (BBBD)) TaxID=630390 RepID=A0A180H244_PUCT1|nr:hypothetical protein PTTG_11875 [Puccinia triticina 1-1 BBBD Race 1]WAR59955.1 hypothetical protein PtB15_11B596 [Puccinia triticina]